MKKLLISAQNKKIRKIETAPKNVPVQISRENDKTTKSPTVLASSYAPKESDVKYILFVAELTELFNEYSKDGVIMTLNVTRSYAGEV